LIEIFSFHGMHPAFGEGVEVGRLGREFERFNVCGEEDGIEILGGLGITVL
jgi:hypothetical protein